MKLRGEVRKGELVIEPASLAIACRQWEGKRVVVEIEPEKSIRSLSQNAYYHAAIVPVVAVILTEDLREQDPDASPLTNEEAHAALKRAFLGKELALSLPVVRSTTKLSTLGFHDYVERCREFCARAGYFIPEPGSKDEVMA